MDYGNPSLGLPSFALSPTSVLSFSDGIGKRLLTEPLVLSARQVVSLSSVISYFATFADNLF